jgi:gas vesicle protein
MLGMVLRLPEKAGKKARMDAFRESVDKIIESANESGLSGYKEVDELYPKVAEMLDIDIEQARAYVAPLGQSKFDKSVGSILMNADLAVSMPEMGEMFRNQIKELAEDVMMSQEEGDQRTIFLAAAGECQQSEQILFIRIHYIYIFSFSL